MGNHKIELKINRQPFQYFEFYSNVRLYAHFYCWEDTILINSQARFIDK